MEKCRGLCLRGNDGLHVGQRRVHYWTTFYICALMQEAFNENNIPVFCAQINEHTNLATNTKMDCPHCAGISYVPFWNVGVPEHAVGLL